jgi:transcriptional regulator with XRE-family HTH domain
MPTPAQNAVVTYPTLVGRVIAGMRDEKELKQSDLALELGLAQSSYSRLEAGESVLNLSQLRIIAKRLDSSPHDVLKLADKYEVALLRQGVQVVSEKQDNSAAIAVGLGLLAAFLLSR